MVSIDKMGLRALPWVDKTAAATSAVIAGSWCLGQISTCCDKVADKLTHKRVSYLQSALKSTSLITDFGKSLVERGASSEGYRLAQALLKSGDSDSDSFMERLHALKSAGMHTSLVCKLCDALTPSSPNLAGAIKLGFMYWTAKRAANVICPPLKPEAPLPSETSNESTYAITSHAELFKLFEGCIEALRALHTVKTEKRDPTHAAIHNPELAKASDKLNEALKRLLQYLQAAKIDTSGYQLSNTDTLSIDKIKGWLNSLLTSVTNQEVTSEQKHFSETMETIQSRFRNEVITNTTAGKILQLKALPTKVEHKPVGVFGHLKQAIELTTKSLSSWATTNQLSVWARHKLKLHVPIKAVQQEVSLPLSRYNPLRLTEYMPKWPKLRLNPKLAKMEEALKLCQEALTRAQNSSAENLIQDRFIKLKKQLEGIDEGISTSETPSTENTANPQDHKEKMTLSPFHQFFLQEALREQREQNDS